MQEFLIACSWKDFHQLQYQDKWRSFQELIYSCLFQCWVLLYSVFWIVWRSKVLFWIWLVRNTKTDHRLPQVTGQHRSLQVNYIFSKLTSDLRGGDLGWEAPTHNGTWPSNDAFMWQIENKVFPLLQNLRPPNLAGWWLFNF